MTGTTPAPSLERRLGSALLWLYITQYSGKLLVFASIAILARVLAPEDFALVALVLAMLVFADSLEVGVGSAIIYFDRAETERTASAAFTLHVATSIVATAAFWVGAPVLADLWGDDQLTWIVRILSLHLVLRALGQTHENLLRRDLDFRSRMVPEFVSGLLKGTGSVALALAGAGVWSLVIGQLLGSTARTALLWAMVPFRPRLDFGRDGKARRLLGYGAPLLVSAIISNVATNVDYLVVGNVLGLTALGFYVIAYRIPQLIFNEALAQIHIALFPYYSRSREEGGDTASRYLLTVRLVALVIAPVLVILTVLAGPTIRVVFGPGWEEAAAILPGLAVGCAFFSIGGLSGDLFKAQGRPYILTVMVAALVVVWVPALLVVAPHGTVAVAWTFAACAGLWAAGYWTWARALLGAGYAAHARAVVPAVVAGAAAAGVAHLVGLTLPDVAALAVGIPLVVGVWLAVATGLSPEVRAMVTGIRRRAARAVVTGDVGAA